MMFIEGCMYAFGEILLKILLSYTSIF